MEKYQVVQEYMDIFYRGGDLDKLREIFATDLLFEGPLYQFNDAESYINALKKDPPKNCNYEIIDKFISDSGVCLIYNFTKGAKQTLMAQTFLIEFGYIKKITLIFNAQDFSG